MIFDIQFMHMYNEVKSFSWNPDHMIRPDHVDPSLRVILFENQIHSSQRRVGCLVPPFKSCFNQLQDGDPAVISE